MTRSCRPFHGAESPHDDDLARSRLQLPPGPWTTVLDCLCARFPAVPRRDWVDRFVRRRVLDADGAALALDAPFRIGAEIVYFREVRDEVPIPFAETVLYADEHLVVADKPHFLPVVPAGRFVRQTLLARLVRRLGNADLVPLHRIDRDTAGLVLFSANPASRACYQALFRERSIVKGYEAWAPALPGLAFPLARASRLARGEPFFRMGEIQGPANSETRIAVIRRVGALWHYALEPVTGRKHQLRVHMAALGAPIVYDRFYPQLADPSADDHGRPLQLLARSLCFIDPMSGAQRSFVSERQLAGSA